MSDIADKIYAATGLTLGAEAAAAIGQMIQVENEKLRAKQADRIAGLEAALATARREGMEEAARIAENEPEPEGEPPIELHGRSVKNIAISSVRATKHSIAAAIRAALEGGKKDE